MKLYLDEREIKEDGIINKDLADIFNIIRNQLEDKIIKKMYINNIEVNEKYIEDSMIDKEDVNELKFETQDVQTLILETSQEIKIYLPKLKSGCKDTSELFRINKAEEMNKKYRLILDGLNWYSKTTKNIISLLDVNKLNKKYNNLMISFNEILSELIVAYESGDNILVADILEYEIVEFINEFQDLNNQVLDRAK